MTVKERLAAITRGKQALAHLEEHPDTTRAQLGAARDQLNIAHNSSSRWEVEDAVFALESIVLNVYGEIPAETA
ncbi:hypothetical protein GCM10011584_34370 [Nocardioides phosphati]|uniref:Uncharacterized protein n=1 Tax=Nocardioides phosphati TaxID=1867775 RepID=A0ABQ2NGJ0_9ACTN|nr:hypothetical protein [Nocardioides phosphati]GGO94103.1 hypothetical protein GCM10011584_34370 [Nocardioides phosphati]